MLSILLFIMLFSKKELPTIKGYTSNSELKTIMPNYAGTPLDQNIEAKHAFNRLSASRQKEIIRYIASLKSNDSVAKDVQKAIGFLTGKNRFVGRDKPLT